MVDQKAINNTQYLLTLLVDTNSVILYNEILYSTCG